MENAKSFSHILLFKPRISARSIFREFELQDIQQKAERVGDAIILKGYLAQVVIFRKRNLSDIQKQQSYALKLFLINRIKQFQQER